MKLKSPAMSFQKAVIDAKSLAVQFWNASIPALEIAVIASKEECTSLAKRTVTEDEFVFTSARSPAPRTARLVPRSVRTDASTADAQKRVWSYAHLAGNHVPGVAHTRNVQSFVARNATVSDAMSHAERPYQEGLVFTTTRASGFVGNHVPSCAESVIRTKLPRSFLALKRRKMHGLLSCWIVVTCLKSLHWTTGWTKMVTTRTLN